MLNSDTNDVTVNGVNVIVDKPKRGDVMCVKDGQVVWIDGLSINPAQLSSEIEPVGICMVVDGNKAIVKYSEAIYDELMNSTYFDVTYTNSYVQTVSYFYLNNGFKMSDPKTMLRFPSTHSSIFYGNTGMSYDCNIYNSCWNTMTDVNWNDTYQEQAEEFGESYLAVSENVFKTNPYCQILRDTYDTYDEYLYSKMIMYPCGKGGAITEQPSGKENTYRLAELGEYASPAAYNVSKISVDAPNLGAGNWWIPSLAELMQIRYEFNSSRQVTDDIVYKVLDKFGGSWTTDVYFSNCLTSTIFFNSTYIPGGGFSYTWFSCATELETLKFQIFGESNSSYIYPITVYEF